MFKLDDLRTVDFGSLSPDGRDELRSALDEYQPVDDFDRRVIRAAKMILSLSHAGTSATVEHEVHSVTVLDSVAPSEAWRCVRDKARSRMRLVGERVEVVPGAHVAHVGKAASFRTRPEVLGDCGLALPGRDWVEIGNRQALELMLAA